MSLDRKTASRVLRTIAELTELAGGNPHRVRAFANAARAVERVEGDLAAMVASGEILELRGIGKGTAGVLAELAEGRQPEALAELEGQVPAGVRELLEISGLGPKRARTLWQDLDIGSVGELEYACRENRLLELPGFGAATQQRLLDSARFQQSARERRLVHQAWQVADEVMRRLSAEVGVERLEVAGELRRGCETVAVVEVVAVGEPSGIEAAAARVLDGAEPEGGRRWAGTYGPTVVPVRLWSASAAQAGWTLIEATGSDAHVEGLRARAAGTGLSVGDGVLRAGTDPVAADEREVYQALGCQWVPPELRECGTEVADAVAGVLPDLIRAEDLRGALHNHSTGSDGIATVEEMAAAAGALGWSFLGIADHSPAAHYANGLTAERLRAQWREIDELNGRGGPVRVLKGLEADILPDGRLDVPEGCEAGLEYVVASVHSSFRMAAEAQTERVLAAVRHPACRILGHPTGRLLLARPGYELDLDRVLEVCAERGVVVEINASPYRLDLDSRWARRALELGVVLAINPDAHETEALADVRWGLSVARRAGAEAGQVLNCGDIEAWVARR